MEILLKRCTLTPTATVGELFINGVKCADTLEDPFRELPAICPNTPRKRNCICVEKVYGKTCIPEGTYQVVWRYSPKLKGYYPALLDVPHFLGILIHAGSTVEHTDGCILTGELVEGEEKLCNQFSITNKIKIMVKDAIKSKEEIWLTIKNVEK